MELTGKCKEEFEEWLVCGNGSINFEKYYNDRHGSDNPYTWFTDLPQSMQYGVYVDFFDSVEDVTENRILSKVSRGFKCYYTELRGNMIVFKTRPEARTAAIEKANEIYNNAH